MNKKLNTWNGDLILDEERIIIKHNPWSKGALIVSGVAFMLAGIMAVVRLLGDNPDYLILGVQVGVGIIWLGILIRSFRKDFIRKEIKVDDIKSAQIKETIWAATNTHHLTIELKNNNKYVVPHVTWIRNDLQEWLVNKNLNK